MYQSDPKIVRCVRKEASLPEFDLVLEKGHIYRTLELIGRGIRLCRHLQRNERLDSMVCVLR